MRLFFCVLVLLVAPIKFSFCATTHELEATKFLNRISETYYKEYDDIIESTLNISKSDPVEALESFNKTSVIAKRLVENIKEAKQFDLNKIQNSDIKRALAKLKNIDFETYSLGVLANEGEREQNILANIAMLNDLATDKDIIPYTANNTTPTDDIKLAYEPDIVDIIKKSTNNDELKYYWEAWRTKNDYWATFHFMGFINAFQNVSKELDLPVMDYWYRFYNNSDFLNEMENVMKEIRPYYQQLHAFAREELYKKYGADVINPQGPIPDHLFRQILDQTWAKDSIIENYFPFSELPPYNEFVKNFTALESLHEAERFFESMGFEPLDSKFWEHYIQEQEEDTKPCTINIVDQTPTVFLEYCPKIDFKKFLQSHSYIARAYYAKEKKHQPSYYFDSYDLEYPVGESVLLSASTPKHLSTIGVAKDFEFTSQILLNRLFRMGIHTLFHIPMHFVHSKIMNDIFNETVDITYINQRYWQLMEEYVGVEPPMDRMSYDFDFPYEFYKGLEVNEQTKKFVSEILGYQFYSAMCSKADQLDQLQNCDFYGHKEVGDALKAMMALGSSKPWLEVINKILPEESKLSGIALLHYYAPVFEWVSKKNSEQEVKIGWNPSTKKILTVEASTEEVTTK